MFVFFIAEMRADLGRWIVAFLGHVYLIFVQTLAVFFFVHLFTQRMILSDLAALILDAICKLLSVLVAFSYNIP